MKKKIVILAMALVGAFSLVGCTTEQAANTAIDLVNSASTHDSAEVLSVKNGYLTDYSSTVTVGRAFDEFLSNPIWQYFDADTGEKVVQVNGTCTYNDKSVEVKVQFILNDDDTFKIHVLAINDIEQNDLMLHGFLSKIFEEADGGTEATTTAPATSAPVQTAPAETVVNYSAYKEPLEQLHNDFGNDGEYALCDLDGDGVKELLISTGFDNSDWKVYVYTINNGEFEALNEFDTGASLLYEAPYGNGVYSVYSHMGYMRIDRISYDGVNVNMTTVSETDNGDEEYTGSSQLTMYNINDYSPLG